MEQPMYNPGVLVYKAADSFLLNRSIYRIAEPGVREDGKMPINKVRVNAEGMREYYGPTYWVYPLRYKVL